jgi:hypothetical protein
MPRKPALLRTSITIPADVLKLADRLAEQLDRSRSWVLGEAVRRWKPEVEGGTPTGSAPERGSQPELSRHEQLHSDMRMTLDARVRAAEEPNLLDRELRPACRAVRLTLFDRYEDYVDWKRYEGIIR